MDTVDFTEVLKDPYARARLEKTKGRKVVGVTPQHFPEEVIHACGALPVVIQESDEPVTLGSGHIHSTLCGFVRSVVDMAVKRKLDFLDVIVVSDLCYSTRFMCDIMSHHMTVPFIYLQHTESINPRTIPFMRKRMGKALEKLYAALGTEADESSLGNSIAIYNRNRHLLKRLYAIRENRPGIISAKELMGVVVSSMVWPKEEHNELLDKFISQVEARRRPAVEDSVRLHLSGHLCHRVRPELLDMIENAGGVIVGDDIYSGYRYFGTETSDSLPAFDALVRHCTNLDFPCPTRSDQSQDWGEYIIQGCKQNSAQGVIILQPMHCEPHMFYYPWIKDKLSKANVPHVLIETEHEVVSLAAVKTRIQAFIEMLRKGKGEIIVN